MATEKRLIDANKLDEILKDFESRYQKACFALSAKAIANARQIVYAMKTVDAEEVVHGRWLTPEEYANQGYNGWLYCSVCEQPMREFYGWDYCPNCGADMRERKDNGNRIS